MQKHFCFALSVITMAMLGFESCSKDDPEVIINQITKDTLIKSEIVTTEKTVDVGSAFPESGKVFFVHPGDSFQLADINPADKSSIRFFSTNPKSISIDPSGKVTVNGLSPEDIYATFNNEIIANYKTIMLGGVLHLSKNTDTYYNQHYIWKETDFSCTMYLYNNSTPLNDLEAIKKLDRIEINYTDETVNSASIVKDGKKNQFSITHGAIFEYYGKQCLNSFVSINDEDYDITYIGDFTIANAEDFKTEGKLTIKNPDGSINRTTDIPFAYGMIWHASDNNEYYFKFYKDEESCKYNDSNEEIAIDVIETIEDDNTTLSTGRDYYINLSFTITKNENKYTIDYYGENEEGVSVTIHYTGVLPYVDIE